MVVRLLVVVVVVSLRPDSSSAGSGWSAAVLVVASHGQLRVGRLLLLLLLRASERGTTQVRVVKVAAFRRLFVSSIWRSMIATQYDQPIKPFEIIESSLQQSDTSTVVGQLASSN